ncbi:hypothetical protein BSMD_028870 [Bacillus subtilis Miyagi-4]|nr:hypothetical protein BSMD_028870 [Bacillus subtilis Miyagi-4]
MARLMKKRHAALKGTLPYDPILEEREVMSRLTVPQIRSNRIRFI